MDSGTVATGWLGIEGTDLPMAEAGRMGVPGGATVEAVLRRQPGGGGRPGGRRRHHRARRPPGGVELGARGGHAPPQARRRGRHRLLA